MEELGTSDDEPAATRICVLISAADRRLMCVSSYFFERDEQEFRNRSFRAFYYMSELDLEPTLEHLRGLPDIKSVTQGEYENGEGWWLEFAFCGEEFYVETWYHGTSTILHVLNWNCNDQILLALVGCFAPLMLIRKPYAPVIVETGDLWGAKAIGMYFFFGLVGAVLAMLALHHKMLE